MEVTSKKGAKKTVTVPANKGGARKAPLSTAVGTSVAAALPSSSSSSSSGDQSEGGQGDNNEDQTLEDLTVETGMNEPAQTVTATSAA